MITSRAAHRIAWRDQFWAGADVVTSVGPLPVPPRSDLVRALRQLAERNALTRVGWTSEHSGWGLAIDLDAYCDRAVLEVPAVPGEAPGDILERVYASGRHGQPIAIVTSGDSIVMNVAHALADGYHMGRLLHAVIETAYTGQLPAWATRATEDRPLRKAMWRFFGRHPERLTALRSLVGARSVEVTAASTETVPWRPHAACVTRTSTTAAYSEMKAWRKTNAPGVSTAALTIAAAERARVELGHRRTEPPLVLFDGRRYLARRDREVPGNFCAGLYLDIDESLHPRAFHDRMGEATELGRPLTALSIGMLRTRLRSRPPETHRPVDPAWNLAHTYMGRPPDIARLPWLQDGRLPCYTGMLTPAGPCGVTLAYTEMGNRINVAASFHDNVIDRAEVEAMLDLMCADPAGLLDVSAGLLRRRAAVS